MNATLNPRNRVIAVTIAAILTLGPAALAVGNIPERYSPESTRAVPVDTLNGNATAANEPSQAPMENSQGVNVNVNLQNQSNLTGAQSAISSEEEPGAVPISERVFLHGFRMGYNMITEFDEAQLSSYGLQSPHQFVIGYEFMQRIIGHDWLNLILVQNVLVGGLEQSAFVPTANLIFGFELANSFQVGFGVNLSLDPDAWSHMIIVAGYTPQIGDIYMPIQAHFVPDVFGRHRMGVSVGFTL